MVQPIDPQLGVPTTPNLDIPQIPYKKLPFPYQDLTDVPQPDNAQYYPDHIPPVVATVAGMHPTGSQAQEIHTDGKNAMLVSDVNASGGSGALWAEAIPQGMQRMVLNPNNHDNDQYGVAKYIFGCWVDASIFDLSFLGGHGIYTQTVEFRINEVFGFAAIPLGGYYDGTMIHGTWNGHFMVMFPEPIDMSKLGYDSGGKFSIRVDNFCSFAIEANFAPITSKLT